MDPRSAGDPIESARTRNEVRARLFGEPPEPVIVGRFVAKARIGRGGMGVVYEATDPELDRKVALKILHSDDAAERILAEAKALARLRHPNVVSVYEVGKFKGHTFIAMEHVEGETLADWLETETRSWRDIVGVFVGAGRGLAAAHAAGLVHRDFKPENVVLDANGEPRVVDFGLARSADDDAPTSLRDVVLAQSESTRSRLAGTPAYMAHELFDGRPATAKSDQYAFSVALYRALFRSSPFEIADTVHGTKRASEPKKPPSSDVPGRIQRAVLKGLAPVPEDRHADMATELAALTRDPTRAWVRSLGFVAILGIAGAVWWQSSRPPLCAGGDARIAEVWGPDARTRVKTAFETSKLSYAKTSFGNVERSLDAYASGWVTMYAESCKATNERGDQSRELLDLRSQCLERRRSALDAVVGVLANADDEALKRSMPIVEGLPSLSACADVTNLQAASRLPEDPAVRGRVQELERKLEEARATFAAGKLKTAAENAKTLADEAQKLDHKPFTGEVAFLVGAIASARGKWDDAERELSLSVKLGQVSGQSELVARAAVKLVQVTGVQQAKFDKAHVWQALAEATVERVADPKLVAEMDLRVAMMLHEEGKIDESLARVERAAERMAEVSGTQTVEYSGYLMAWGNILDTKGRYQEALETSNEALALREKLLGPKHPEVARTLNNIGVIYSRIDKYEEAKRSYERAIQIAEEVGDMDTYTGFLDNLSGTLFKLGRVKEGFQMRNRALHIREKTLPPDHPDLAMSWNNLGVQYFNQKRYDDAREAYEKALAINRKAYGNDHSEVALALANLSEVNEVRNDFDGARALLLEALEIEEKGNRDSTRSAIFLARLGRTEVAMKRYEQALPRLERAIRMLEKSKSNEAQLALSRFAMAKVLWEHKHDKQAARALAEKAKQGPFAGADLKPIVSEIEDWLRTHR